MVAWDANSELLQSTNRLELKGSYQGHTRAVLEIPKVWNPLRACCSTRCIVCTPFFHPFLTGRFHEVSTLLSH